MTAEHYIDNSALLPAYLPDSRISLEDSGNGLRSPDWVKSLIIEQVNVASASPDGKFSGMPFVLRHLAEVGVNCIWLNPIFDGRHYYNYGPGTLNPLLTGTSDYGEGLKIVKDFVDAAHEHRIRVLFDIVTWGVNPQAPIFKEHPDWFSGYSDEYRGPMFDWNNSELFDWFSDRLIELIKTTGADGYRADCGIEFCGPELYSKVRRVLHGQGKYIALIGEAIAEGTQRFFDLNEHSIDYWTTKEGTKFLEGEVNFTSGYKPDMISAVKEGKGLDTRQRQAADAAGRLRFYSSIVSCHDSPGYVARGRTAAIVYSSVLSPFIPMWYIGEEWNNPYTGTESSKWLYANKIDWSKKAENREFYETVKKAVRIRRLFPEVFEYFPLNHREINFCAVQTDRPDALPAYARTADGYGIIVVPNYSPADMEFEITVPLDEFGIAKDSELVTADLISGERLNGSKTFKRVIPASGTGVYLVSVAEKASRFISLILGEFKNDCI